MKHTILYLLLLIGSTLTAFSQNFEQTEQYAFLELHCINNSTLISFTDGSGNTRKIESYKGCLYSKTGHENAKLIRAMNDLNLLGYKLKSDTFNGDDVNYRRIFVFKKDTSEKEDLQKNK